MASQMTIEEAIFCEKSYIGETNCTDCIYYQLEACRSREAHKMAVKALEQESCDDCISRQEILREIEQGTREDKMLKEIDHLHKYISKLEIQIAEQGPCEDAISRQAVLEIYNKWFRYCNVAEKKESPKAQIKALPSVTPKQKTGRWIFVDKAHEHARCSECGYGDVDLMDGKPHNYCQNCGTKMLTANTLITVEANKRSDK